MNDENRTRTLVVAEKSKGTQVCHEPHVLAGIAANDILHQGVDTRKTGIEGGRLRRSMYRE